MRSGSTKRAFVRSGFAFGVGLLAWSALVLSDGAARAADDAPPGSNTAGQHAKTTKSLGKTAKTAKSSKRAIRKKSTPQPESTEKPALAKRRRIGAGPAYVVGDTNAHMINESAPPLEAFPSDSTAVKKAFSETRRDQLVDAEKAARDAKTPDRWRTVLFMLRGLPERTDPEACFWRVLSFYRLGEEARARTLREACELPPKDTALLNEEDARASGVPQMGTIARDDGFGAPGGATNAKTEVPATPPPPPVAASAPYTGPSPQRK
jgi:hypothetical protein